MSIDIDWENLATGPEGLYLAETIRAFIDNKFQQVHLPGFIRSVHVHSFDFGKECPVIELKDIGDPLPDFYDDEDSSGDEQELTDVEPAIESLGHSEAQAHTLTSDSVQRVPPAFKRPTYIDARSQGLRSSGVLVDPIGHRFLSRSGTPGIPGGTSNLSYFHLPLSAGLSGSQTPLAAVAGGSPFGARPDYHFPIPIALSRPQSPRRRIPSYADPSSRPSTSDSHQQPSSSPIHPNKSILVEDGEQAHPPPVPSPLDTQITLHITYTGNVSLSITASLLLDYPMSSFAFIPLKLSITGLSFDGVALLAYLRKKAHFCFLGPEDAQILVGAENKGQEEKAANSLGMNDGKDKLGGLIKEIKVESEIGKRDNGKQSLKNVGKVEKFVVEQVRKIFEEEFVWPSWWTFLV